MSTSLLSEATECIVETDLPVRPEKGSQHAYYGDLQGERLFERHVRYHEDMLWFAAFDSDGTEGLDVGSAFGVFLVRLVSHGRGAQ